MDELIRLLREFNQRDDVDLDGLIAQVERFAEGTTPDANDEAPNPLREWAQGDPMSDEDLDTLIAGLTALGDDDEASAALLGEAADLVVTVRAEVGAREAQAEADEAERQDAIARLRGEDPEAGRGQDDEGDNVPDGDDDGATEADDADSPDDDAGDGDAATAQPEPVTAAGNRAARRAARRNLARRRPRDAAPVETETRPRVSFGIDVPGFGHGDEGTLTDVNRALVRRYGQFRHTRGKGTEQFYPVATIHRHFDEDRTLSDARGRMLSPDLAAERVHSVIAAAIAAYRNQGPQALTAAGGLCAPLQPIYDVPTLGEQSRPIRDTALVSFQATRGGVVSVTPPSLAQVVAQDPNSVGIWTMQNDEDAVGGSPVKSCARIECNDPVETTIQAITKCLIIGNIIDRTFSEYVGAWSELAMVHQDRVAELALFNQILAAEITHNVSVASTTISATRDLLNHLALTAWNLRSRHRVGRTFPFRVILPELLFGIMQNDIANALPGGSFAENLNVAEQMLDTFFTSRALNVTWSPDLVVQDELADGQPVPAWPGSVPYALYPEGTFLHLDAGELDLGVVRDSTLNQTNDFEIFAETFEAAHPIGVEAVAGTIEVCPSGAVQGTHDPADFLCPAS